jgi:hypothetical protein
LGQPTRCGLLAIIKILGTAPGSFKRKMNKLVLKKLSPKLIHVTKPLLEGHSGHFPGGLACRHWRSGGGG